MPYLYPRPYRRIAPLPDFTPIPGCTRLTTTLENNDIGDEIRLRLGRVAFSVWFPFFLFCLFVIS